MYAIYAYIGVVWGANVGIYGIHGASGIAMASTSLASCFRHPEASRKGVEPEDGGVLGLHWPLRVQGLRLAPKTSASTILKRYLDPMGSYDG